MSDPDQLFGGGWRSLIEREVGCAYIVSEHKVEAVVETVSVYLADLYLGRWLFDCGC